MYESTNHNETYVPEKARALFKRQRALRKLNRVKDADVALEDCYKLYSKLFDQNLALTPPSPQPGEQLFTSGCRNQTESPEAQISQKRKKAESKDLTDEDFDELITFWSK